jgi:broad specificity phosphatase PhoE
MKILLARHGETPWNAEGRYQGQIDIPLSPVGEGQARALGARLADARIDRAVASPLARARTTAEFALGDARRDLLATDAGLMEIGHGEWEGLLASEIRERDPERLQAWRDAPDTVLMPGAGGETLQAVLDRAWPAFERATVGLGDDDTLLVVAHDAVNRVLLCRILGLPLSRLWSFRQAPTTINLLEGPSPDRLEVVRLNDCQHHTALFGEAVHRAL